MRVTLVLEAPVIRVSSSVVAVHFASSRLKRYLTSHRRVGRKTLTERRSSCWRIVTFALLVARRIPHTSTPGTIEFIVPRRMRPVHLLRATPIATFGRREGSVLRRVVRLLTMRRRAWRLLDAAKGTLWRSLVLSIITLFLMSTVVVHLRIIPSRRIRK